VKKYLIGVAAIIIIVGFFVLFENPLARIYYVGGKAVCEFRGGTFSGDENMTLGFGTPSNCKFFEIKEDKRLGCKGDEQCRKACSEKNGEWRLVNSDPGYYICNFKTSDAGKICTDYSQCESHYCIPDQEEKNDSKINRELTGKCSEWLYQTGSCTSSGLVGGKNSGLMSCY